MRTHQRKNCFSLYSNQVIFDIIFCYAVACLASLYGFFCLLRKAFVEGYSGSAILLIILILSPCYVFPVFMYRLRMGVRLFARCRFDEIGIHCYYLLWGAFTVRWDNIHTYGFFNSRAGYVSMDLVFLSTDPHEVYDRKKLYAISKNRMIFEYRPDFWAAFTEYMPQDIKKHLEESLDTGRNCYVKR